VNEFQPIEPNSSSTESESSIQQKAENSTVDGGMQAVVGDNNTQNQANSNSSGNVVNVNVSVNPQAQETDRSSLRKDENHEPNLSRRRTILGCSFRVVVFGVAVSISLLNIVVVLKSPTPPDITSPSIPSPSMSPNEDTESLLNSADYLQLRRLLRTSEWKEADLKTRSVLLRLSDKQEQDFLTVRDFEKISCTSLSLIDDLWMQYSGGGFGLGTQSRVWEISGENYITFSSRVGWLNNGSWSKPQEFNVGGLPRAPWWGIMNKSEGAEAIFYKVRRCRIEYRR
jgi:hypothetical protein